MRGVVGLILHCCGFQNTCGGGNRFEGKLRPRGDAALGLQASWRAEAELWERMRPGGQWQVTKPAEMTITKPTTAGPTKVTFACPTPAASIAYTTQAGKKPHWLLYTKPVEVPAGSTIRAKAIRLGFRESPEVSEQTK